MPLAPLLPVILPAAIAAVSSFLNQRSAQKAARREYNDMLAYNAPKAQMARFQEAGLSPYLMYGQGNAGNAPGPRPAESPNYEAFGKFGSDTIGNYMALANFDANQRLLAEEIQNKGYMGQKMFYSADIAEIKRQRDIAELYSDFPGMLDRMDRSVDPSVVTSGFRMKMNELKRSVAKANLDRIEVGIDSLNYKNVVDRVKAKYAEDFGMVGGDWTQGLGLLKSLPSMFKGARKGATVKMPTVPGKSFNQGVRDRITPRRLEALERRSFETEKKLHRLRHLGTY